MFHTKYQMAQNSKLPFRIKLGYGAGEFASSIFWITIAFWLMNYLTDEVGLPGTMAGAALMIGKIWDEVTDPAVGFLSDRTRSRWGRRRPWLLFGAIPFGLAYLVMFTNPGIESRPWLFVYITVAFILLCTTYTVTNVPYNSLIPELTKDFNDRSSLSGFKSIFAVFGTIAGAVAAYGHREPDRGIYRHGDGFRIIDRRVCPVPLFHGPGDRTAGGG